MPNAEPHRSGIAVALRLVARKQLPWRAAIAHSLYRASRDPFRLGLGVVWALAASAIFSIRNESYLLPVYISILYSAAITFASAAPWRVRLVPRRRAGARSLLVFNGLLALIAGLMFFFLAIASGHMIFIGVTETMSRMQSLAVASIWGVVYTITGLPIVLSEEGEIQRRLSARREERLQAAAREARVIALRARMNPHFFFNALNTIAALIPERPADAERAVELLAQSLRPVLKQDQPLLARLGDELKVALAYGEIELLRMGGRAVIEVDVPPELLGIDVPSLSLQPLLENAFVHGAGQTSGDYHIEIRAQRQSDGLLLTVLDGPVDTFAATAATDAPPCPVSEIARLADGHALDNLRRRLHALFGAEARLELRLGTGTMPTRAAISLPASGPTPLARRLTAGGADRAPASTEPLEARP